MPVLKKESTMKIEKLSPNFGAEVIGADLTCPVSDAVRKQLFDALHENIALVIRDQNFTPDQYVAAGSIFGELMLEDQPEKYGLPGYPLVRVLNSQMKDGPYALKGAAQIHHDVSGGAAQSGWRYVVLQLAPRF